MTPQEIISDDEIARVHGNANFGAMDPREVVNDGVRKTAVGYHCGSTQLHILRDHGLVTKPRPGSSDADLTKKGKAYARSIYRDTTPARAEAQDEGAAGEPWGYAARRVRFRGSPTVGGWTPGKIGDGFYMLTVDDPDWEIITLYAHPSPTPAADADSLIDDEWRALVGDGPDAFANPASINHDEFRTAIRGVLAALKSEGK